MSGLLYGMVFCRERGSGVAPVFEPGRLGRERLNGNSEILAKISWDFVPPLQEAVLPGS
jgi:hypothetical protein